jgi:hypothetical protein
MPSLHINEQARHLPARPFALPQVAGILTVIVIDALADLSEHGDEEQGLVSLLVPELEDQANKLLVTSRDEPRFSNRLDALTYDTFKLLRMEQSSISRDIRSFYESRFRQLVASRRLNVTD